MAPRAGGARTGRRAAAADAAAGAREQDPSDEQGAPVDLPSDLAELPEADLLEQAQLVDEEQTKEEPVLGDDAAEADVLEQSIGVTLDEERR